MHQRSLLDDAFTEPGRAVVGIVGSAPALTPAQRKFNQLIERLTLQRQELARWQAFKHWPIGSTSSCERTVRNRNSRHKKKSAKTIVRETLRDEAAQGGTQAVREVFRKLVSELHPDRETDPAEHARDTELMQRVNQAYKAG
jgi:hypothetical protein